MEVLKDLPGVAALIRAQLDALIENAMERVLDAYVARVPPPRRSLRTSEVAALLQISESQLGNLCRKGLPYQPCGDRIKRFDLEKVKAWLHDEWLRERAEAGEPLKPGQP